MMTTIKITNDLNFLPLLIIRSRLAPLPPAKIIRLAADLLQPHRHTHYPSSPGCATKKCKQLLIYSIISRCSASACTATTDITRKGKEEEEKVETENNLHKFNFAIMFVHVSSFINARAHTHARRREAGMSGGR